MALGAIYATLTQLKLRLEMTRGDDDVRLTAALTAASRGIEKFCGRQFNTADTPTARVYRPESHGLCFVDDLQSISSLKTDDNDSGSFGTTWSANEYELAPLNGIVDGEAGWPYSTVRVVGYAKRFYCYRRATVQVTALWGWAAVPASVTEACLIAAVELVKLKDTPFGIGGYGDFGIVRVRDNPFTARMLAPYRRNPVLVA